LQEYHCQVYQQNVNAEGSAFHSFKKVMTEMGTPYNGLKVASVMSCSKGFMGECGIRGVYAEVVNMDPGATAMLQKSSIKLDTDEFPEDAESRTECNGSYCDGPGVEVIKRHMAEYIMERDGGIESDWRNIILCAGVSEVCG
jgi:aspartate/methionine/tyrosine aminotransferase